MQELLRFHVPGRLDAIRGAEFQGQCAQPFPGGLLIGKYLAEHDRLCRIGIDGDGCHPMTRVRATTIRQEHRHPRQHMGADE
ncbi:Uncharacterised protein [Mycobacteroides abscessus subsp. abscessus]|nr:Uncharacterised protein [Mycobacteroides abscessus subsp. abscessus]